MPAQPAVAWRRRLGPQPSDHSEYTEALWLRITATVWTTAASRPGRLRSIDHCRSFPRVCAWLTHASFCFELGGPLLMLYPLRAGAARVRIAACVAFVGFHAGLHVRFP